MNDTHNELEQLSGAVLDRFLAEKRVLSFQEYLSQVLEHPVRHTRDAARYLKSCFDHFGNYAVQRPWGETRRWRLFDLDFDGNDADRRREFLVGQEHAQNAFYRSLSNFVREGRANRLVLLYGPNGSAKSTFASCLMNATEHYSTTDEGALYRFAWIFPRGRDGKSIGFGSADEGPEAHDSYAHLPPGKVEVKLVSELREHPLLLLPREERRRLLAQSYERAGVRDNPPDLLLNGQLGQKNKDIFEALLTAYGGEIGKVLAHVQVERYYISRRFRTGAVTIGPQMAVDASERQLTADRSLGSLPASLSTVTLFETAGELVDGSAGVIEYSDLLTRSLEAWKYLLLAIETGEVALQFSILPVNAVLVASSNDLHLRAFREHPEYRSFRGRLQLVRMPYLLDYRQEQQIYDAQIIPQVQRPVARHTTLVAAMWAVLTRLLRPRANNYDSHTLRKVAISLTPVEKLQLYAHGTIPPRLSSEESKELRAGTERVFQEFDGEDPYEGAVGASPREIRTLLLDAAQHPDYACLSPLAVLDRVEALCREQDFDYLRREVDKGYYDHRAFVDAARQEWLTRLDDEVRTSSGLVEEEQYRDLFERYITHVSLWVKNERYENPLTGQPEDPDRTLMTSVEEILGADDPEEFRRNLINTIAAHAIDNPGQAVDHSVVSAPYLDRVKAAFFGERAKQVAEVLRGMLAVLSGEQDRLDKAERAKAQAALQAFKNGYGYGDACAREVLGELLARRYAEY